MIKGYNIIKGEKEELEIITGKDIFDKNFLSFSFYHNFFSYSQIFLNSLFFQCDNLPRKLNIKNKKINQNQTIIYKAKQKYPTRLSHPNLCFILVTQTHWVTWEIQSIIGCKGEGPLTPLQMQFLGDSVVFSRKLVNPEEMAGEEELLQEQYEEEGVWDWRRQYFCGSNK